MKKIKKAAALLLAAVMLLSLAACGSFETRMAKAANRMGKLESLHMDMDMKIDMSVSTKGQSLNMNMSVTGGMDMQTEPMRMKMDMTLSAMGFSQQILSYMEKTGEEYTVYASMDGGSTWEQETVDADEAPAQVNMMDGLKLFADCASSFKEAGTEDVLGSAATRYDGELTGEDMKKAMEISGADELLSQSLGTEIDGDDISRMGSIATSVWIDNKSGMIVRYDMDMTQIMQNLMAELMDELFNVPGTEGLEIEMEISGVTVSVVLSQFDQVGEIEIPGAAM